MWYLDLVKGPLFSKSRAGEASPRQETSWPSSDLRALPPRQSGNEVRAWDDEQWMRLADRGSGPGRDRLFLSMRVSKDATTAYMECHSSNLQLKGPCFPLGRAATEFPPTRLRGSVSSSLEAHTEAEILATSLWSGPRRGPRFPPFRSFCRATEVQDVTGAGPC